MIVSRGQLSAGPVAVASVAALLERVDDLSKGWAKALIDELPFERLAEVPLERLVRELPGICAGALRALTSDAELERLVGAKRLEPARVAAAEDALRAAPAVHEGGAGAALRLGELAGARDLRAALRAVELLRIVIWRAICEALHEPDPRQVADLAERLAHVCATIVGALAASAAESIEHGLHASAVEQAFLGVKRGLGPDVKLARSPDVKLARGPDVKRARVVVVDELAGGRAGEARFEDRFGPRAGDARGRGTGDEAPA